VPASPRERDRRAVWIGEVGPTNGESPGARFTDAGGSFTDQRSALGATASAARRRFGAAHRDRGRAHRIRIHRMAADVDPGGTMRKAGATVAIGMALCALAVSAPTRAGGQAPPDTLLHKEQLADGIWLFRAPSALDQWTATNVVVVINDADVTVFDSNTRLKTARMVIAGIRALTDKPVGTLINSHWHMDHWSGNSEYVKAFPGVQIIATTQTRDFMKRMGPKFFVQELDPVGTRATLDSAVRTGKLRDGSPLTPEARRRLEADVEETDTFAAEVGAVPRVLPTLAYRDTLIFWRGGREFRLFSETGDATASTVMYLPREKLLVTGDVLVAPEKRAGPPPWTTNSFSITPWLASLRSLRALDVAVIVPGQGPAMHDKAYLDLTIELFASVIDQVHAALERGAGSLQEVQAAVNADAIGRRYLAPGATLSPDFHFWVASFAKKVFQESTDGTSK
jgi:cyclase